MTPEKLQILAFAGSALLLGHAALAEDSILQPADEAAEDAAADTEAAQPEGDQAFVDRWMSGWEGGIEIGLSGSTGNTEEIDIYGRGDATRENDETKTTAFAFYEYGKEDGDVNENSFYGLLRNEWYLEGRPRWSIYLQGTYEYDDFEDWYHRITIGPGVGYKAIDTEETQLDLRAGGQLRREFGGSDSDWALEAVLGFSLAHQLSERQELGWNFDLYPRLDEFGPYRFITDAFWKIDVDPETNLYLRLGVRDEYDSSPGAGIKRNDLDYYATLGWSF